MYVHEPRNVYYEQIVREAVDSYGRKVAGDVDAHYFNGRTDFKSRSSCFPCCLCIPLDREVLKTVALVILGAGVVGGIFETLKSLSLAIKHEARLVKNRKESKDHLVTTVLTEMRNDRIIRFLSAGAMTGGGILAIAMLITIFTSQYSYFYYEDWLIGGAATCGLGFVAYSINYYMRPSDEFHASLRQIANLA